MRAIYITPNLCTIGTKTFSSDKTVRDASPRVCLFCEAASEKGKLALKHVQGLTLLLQAGVTDILAFSQSLSFVAHARPTAS